MTAIKILTSDDIPEIISPTQKLGELSTRLVNKIYDDKFPGRNADGSYTIEVSLHEIEERIPIPVEYEVVKNFELPAHVDGASSD